MNCLKKKNNRKDSEVQSDFAEHNITDRIETSRYKSEVFQKSKYECAHSYICDVKLVCHMFVESEYNSQQTKTRKQMHEETAVKLSADWQSSEKVVTTDNDA